MLSTVAPNVLTRQDVVLVKSIICFSASSVRLFSSSPYCSLCPLRVVGVVLASSGTGLAIADQISKKIEIIAKPLLLICRPLRIRAWII